jgi:DNA-binding CsgD family transcriptional regulator
MVLSQASLMKRFIKALGQRFREIFFLLISLPISIFLFAVVTFGLSPGGFLPIGILIFLLLLTVMQYVAGFEIKRTNWILRTDFKVIDNWFSYPFFSWDGVKERVTSLRSWMAVAYVFIAFGWTLFATLLIGIGFLALLVVLVAIGDGGSSFNRSFIEFFDDGSTVSGVVSFNSLTDVFRLQIGDQVDDFLISWNLDSLWVITIALIFLILAIWVIPRNARAMAQMVEGLLSGTYLPKIEDQIRSFSNRKKVSEREVREAMESGSRSENLSELSQREREILALMAQGKTNAAIAKSLYITEGSVEKHVSSILSKLGIEGDGDTHRRVKAVLHYLGIEG